MSSTRSCSATALAILLPVAALPAVAQGLPPHTIIVEHWPEDVPCNVLKRYPDGTYEVTVPYVLYYSLHLRTKFKGLGIGAYWDRKCKGLTK